MSDHLTSLPTCPLNILKGDYEKIIEAHQAIMSNLSMPMPTIAQLASQANMSPSKFRNLFLQMYGMSIYQYHLNARIELAKTLLISNQYSIVQIAYKVGFNRSQSFAKAFLAHTGQTATEYKRDMLSKIMTQ
jgi:AraC-like DNA-binding protein